MHRYAPTRRSFLISTLILCTTYFIVASANIVLVDDQAENSNVNWDGPWERLHGIEEGSVWNGTLSLGTPPYVTTVKFTFTGIWVQVFGVVRIFDSLLPPELSTIRSQFSIDGGMPTEFILFQPVLQPFTRQKFYNSAKLSPGNHTLAITNLGDQLLLDYFQFDDGNGPTSGTSINVTATTTTQSSSVDATTATTTLRSSSTTIITAPWSLSSIKDNTGWTTSSTSESAISSRSSAAVSPSSSASLAPFTVTATFPLSSLIHPSSLIHLSSLSLSSSSTLFPNATTLPQGAETSQPRAHRISRRLLVGIIVCVLIVSAILLAILLHVARRYQRRAHSRIAASRYPFLHSHSRDTDDESFFAPESPYSTTSAAIPVAGCPESIPDREGAGPCSRREPCLQAAIRRSKDGGVRVAGGPRELAYSDAPSISDAASEKSTLPPSYREYDCDYP